MAGSVRQVAVEYLGKATGLRKATDQAEDAVEGFAKSADQAGEKAADGLGSKLTGKLESAQAGLSKVGAATGVGAGLAIGASLVGAMEKQKVGSKLGAQLNLTKKESAQVGKVAGNLYANAYGESMEEVSGAVAAVRSNIGGMNKASSKDLEAVTKNALDFATAMGVDVGDASVTAGTLVKTHLAKNGKEAFDLMTAAAQKAGPQMTEPVLEATNEYAKHFAGLGFDGKQAMSILSTAASGGEIAIDKAGDAIKEFQIRATDLGDTGAQQALKDLGLDGDKTANALLKGGKSAQTATAQIAKGLLSVKDPAKQAQLTTALFGTQAEDIGKDNMPAFLKSLTGAGDALGKVDGRAAAMGKTLNDNAATNIETFKRSTQSAFVSVLGDTVLPIFTKFTGGLASNQGAMKAVVGVTVGLAAGITLLSGAVKVVTVVTQAWAIAQKVLNASFLTNPVFLVIAGIVALGAALVIAYKKSETFRKIVNGAFAGVKAVAGAVVGWFTGSVVPFFTKKLPGAFGAVISWTRKNWPTILGILTGPIGWAVLAITKNKDKIAGVFTGLKNWVGTTWKKGWSKARGWMQDPVGNAKKGIDGLLSKTGARAAFTNFKSWTGTTWKRGWSAAKGWIHDPVGSAQKAVSKTLGNKGVRAVFNGLDRFGSKVFGPKWAGMKAKLSKPIQDAKDYFARIFKKGAKGGFLTLFSDMVRNAGAIFAKLKSALLSPIKAAIGAVNTGLIKGGINWLLTKLGVPKKSQVPWIPVPKFRTGGPIGGRGGPRDDKNLIMASRGEFMQPTDSVQHYGLDVMEGIRTKSIPKEALTAAKYGQYQRTGALDPNRSGGFADGGLVTYGGGRFSEKFARVVMALSKAVPNFQMYQGGWNAGGVAASGGTHDKDAIDYGPANRASETAGRRLGGAAWLRNPATGWTSTMPHVHMIPSPSLGILAPSAAAQWRNYLDGENGLVNHGRDTGTRAYVGKGGSAIGGILSGALNFLKGLSPVDWLMKKASGLAGARVGGGPFGAGLMSKVPGMIISKAKNWIADKIGLSGGETAWTGGKVGGWNSSQLNNAATIISVARSLGFGQRGAQIGVMTAMQESTLNNLSGGDRDSVGLFQQRAPWGSFADRTNPAKAARMFYLGGQGGQPGLKSKPWRSMGLGAAAQAVQVSGYPGAYDKWAGQASALVARSFDTGGDLHPGWTLAFNGTGQTETIRTAQQEAALTGGPQIVINVNGALDPVAVGRQIAQYVQQYTRNTGGVQLNLRGRSN